MKFEAFVLNKAIVIAFTCTSISVILVLLMELNYKKWLFDGSKRNDVRIHWLLVQSSVFPEKLIVTQLVKEITTFHETQIFIWN
jgi:hypothetical protein